MPERPDRREDKARPQRRISFLQPQERKSAPARFFAEPDEEEDENETLGQFPPGRGGRHRAHLSERGHDRERHRAKHHRQSEDNGVPAQSDPTAHNPREQVPDSRPAPCDSRYDQRRDKRPKRVWPRSASLRQGQKPWVP